MDFLPFTFYVLLAGTLFLILLMKRAKRRRTNGSVVHLPPGPSKLPLIGSMHHLVGPLPHRTLRDLANKHGGLMHVQLGEVSAVVISSAEFAKEVMVVNQANFASRPSTFSSDIMSYNRTDIAFASYGEYWRQLRKLCTLELLSVKRVKSFWPIREEELTRLMKVIASKEGSAINITREVSSSIYTITSKAAFGKKCEDQEQFIKLIRESSEILGGFDIVDVYPSAKWLHFVSGTKIKLKKLHQEADGIMEKIVDQHKMEKSNTGEDGEDEAQDLVDVLLKYQLPNEDNFNLTTENIKAIILDVFGAGGDTAAAAIVWAMSEMMKNPRVMIKAQCEVREVFDKIGKIDEASISKLHYLKLVVKETLRLHPPVPLLLPRECEQSCKIGGYEIPMKTKVIVNAWALGRDPKYWTDPESFHPERFIDQSKDYRGTNLEYIPFGAGRRICPGLTYGIAMVEMALTFLLYHFDWKLEGGVGSENLDMTEIFGVVTRRKHDLELIPIAHRP